MKAYRGSRLWLHSFSISRWHNSHPSRFNAVKDPQYQPNTRTRGPQNRSIHLGKHKNLLLLPEFEPTIVGPIAHYRIDCAIRLPLNVRYIGIFCRWRYRNIVAACYIIYKFSIILFGFGGLGLVCWPLVPKFVGSNPAEAVGFLGRKIPQHAFIRRGSKAVGPMS